MLHEERADHLRRRRREVVLAPEAVLAPQHRAEVMVLAPEVLEQSRHYLFEDALLDEVRHAILSVSDAANSRAPLLRRLWLLDLRLLRLAPLLLFRALEEEFEVRELLAHLLVDKGAELGLDDREHVLPGELHVVALVEVVALVPVFPLFCVLVDVLDELLHHRTGAHIMSLFLLGAAVLLPALALLPLVILGLGLLAFPIFALLCLVFLDAVILLVELVELIRELAILVESLITVQDPLPALFQQVRLDIGAFLLLQPLELLLEGLLVHLIGILLHLLPPIAVLLHVIDDVRLGVVPGRRHAQELELLLPHPEEAPAVDLPLPMRCDARRGQHLALEDVLGAVALLRLLFLPRLLPDRVLAPCADHLRTIDAHAAPLVLLDDRDRLVCR
mmetsp:Transcript_73358/g.224386  ORF Transcript_73358/g.224386 Transcript_73358/m.224386 type:complete len:390 (+) Transcript_73358:750-1919(+)